MLVKFMTILYWLIVGGAIDATTSWTYCIGQGPCPSDKDCTKYCLESTFLHGGKCIGNQCCCIR